MRGSTAGLTVSLKGESPAHYALLTVLDAAFAIFIVAPSVVGYWRGVWELTSIYVYPDDQLTSALISIVLGFGGLFFCGIYQHTFAELLDPNKRRLTYMFASRLYTAVFGITCVNSWRGVWLLVDSYTDQDVNTVLATTGVSVVALAAMRILRNISAPPFSVVTDDLKGYFEVPTMFRIPSSQKNSPVYVLDCLFSVFVVGTLVVFVWRGAWVLVDILMFPDDEAASAIGSLILGYVTSILAFLLQPVMRWVCERLTGIWRILAADLYLLFSFIGTVNVWRGIWNLLNQFYLPDEPELSCWSTHLVCLFLLILLKCANSVLVRGVYIDAEEPAGKCVVFPCYYLRLYFQHERAKKCKNQIHALTNSKKTKSIGGDIDFSKMKPLENHTMCTCHLSETAANHITVNVPLVSHSSEFDDSDDADKPNEEC